MTASTTDPGPSTTPSADARTDADATRLSTAPAPRTPPRESLTAPVRRAWRQLVSTRTALLLLFLLALASVPGSFLPQRDLNPLEVQDYFLEHPTLAPLLDRLSLFDVFASPWFAAIYLLLFVSLIGCLSSRLRLHARALRTPPPEVPRVLGRLPAHERWTSSQDAAAVLADARRSLRRSSLPSASRPRLPSSAHGPWRWRSSSASARPSSALPRRLCAWPASRARCSPAPPSRRSRA